MRKRDNRLTPTGRQRQRWAQLPGMQPHADSVQVDEDSWSGRPAIYQHVSPDAVDGLRQAATTSLLTVWTVDPAAPRTGQVHLNRYTLSVAQALELIAGAARGRWVEEIVHIEPVATPNANTGYSG